MKRALLFGASGQIGDALLPMLREAGCEVVAVSRSEHADEEGLRWIRGGFGDDLAMSRQPFDAIFSLGPLDAFARWLQGAGAIAPRVIAFGSTSVATKTSSRDAGERDVAERLRSAEESLFATAAQQRFAATVLRPTLVYGRGRDRTLSRIVAIAQRHGVFPLPRNATGLRQPVHVDDLAAAALACATRPLTTGRAYDVPGGESLPYDTMVARTLAALQPSPRLLRLPSPLFRAAVRLALALGRIDAINPAMLDRLDADLVFDGSDARRDFDYSPRAFAPDATMFARPR